jgi:hypothetical protein
MIQLTSIFAASYLQPLAGSRRPSSARAETSLRIPLLCDDVGSVLQHCSSQPGRRPVETEPRGHRPKHDQLKQASLTRFHLESATSKILCGLELDTWTAYKQFRAQLSGSHLGDRYSGSIASSTVALNFLTPSFCGFLIRLMSCLGLGDFCGGRYEYGLLRRSICGVVSKEDALKCASGWYSLKGSNV